MVIGAMLLALVQAGPSPAVPTPEAIALGERLARTGTLAALLTLVERKETEELVAGQPSLSAAEQAQLRATAARTYAAAKTRLFAVQGRRYAELLTADDLRQLAVAAEQPAARRLQAALPGAIASVAGALEGVDAKKDALAAFCRETGKGCAEKK